MNENHKVTITSGGGLFFLHCPTCGKVGTGELYEGDAENIAARHEEIGGFG